LKNKGIVLEDLLATFTQ